MSNNVAKRVAVRYDDNMKATKNIHKGDLVATEVVGNTVRLWFDSPTGDSSDSQIADLQCATHDQAVAIANRHNEIWGIDVQHHSKVWYDRSVEPFGVLPSGIAETEGIDPIW